MLHMETTMDMFFILDILINFRTGYYIQDLGIVEYDPKKVHHFAVFFFFSNLTSPFNPHHVLLLGFPLTEFFFFNLFILWAFIVCINMRTERFSF
jgi:hypothetical protein